MKKQFVTYKIALKLKELGFNEKSKFGQETSLYDKNGNHVFYSNYGFMGSGLGDNYIHAPLWQQCIQFLKTKGVLVVELWDGWEYGRKDEDLYYCETLEKAVLKAIKLCKSN